MILSHACLPVPAIVHIGAPGWDRTIRVIDSGFTDRPATFYGLPTHIISGKWKN